MVLPIDLLLHKGKGIYALNKANKVYEFEKVVAVREANALLFDELAYWIERFMIRADRFSMTNSMELRLPFMRKELVRLALNIPFDKKIKLKLAWKSKRLYETKTLLRGLAKTIGIPKEIISQRKIGTQFTSSSNIEKLFSKWDFSSLANFFDWDLRAFQLEGNRLIIPDRLKVSLICGDVFIRLFQNGESAQQVDSELRKILGAV
jgi:hypothetical protein